MLCEWAAERSRRIRILMWPESAAMRRSLVSLMRAVSVLWRALKGLIELMVGHMLL